MPVELTQASVREILAIPQETMRHWRKVLPALASRGRLAKLSAGDLVALAIIRDLVRTSGINASAIAPYASSLFDVCNSRPWHALVRSRLQIEGMSVHLVPALSMPPNARGPLISIQLRHVIQDLVDRLGARPGDQIELMFPLATVAGRKP